MRDLPQHPEKLVARLLAAGPTSYVLVADTLAALPPGLVRSGRQPADPPKVVEVWMPAPASSTPT